MSLTDVVRTSGNRMPTGGPGTVSHTHTHTHMHTRAHTHTCTHTHTHARTHAHNAIQRENILMIAIFFCSRQLKGKRD